jgi:hypothetical protein
LIRLVGFTGQPPAELFLQVAGQGRNAALVR